MRVISGVNEQRINLRPRERSSRRDSLTALDSDVRTKKAPRNRRVAFYTLLREKCQDSNATMTPIAAGDCLYSQLQIDRV